MISKPISDDAGFDSKGGPAIDEASQPYLRLQQLRRVIGHVHAAPPGKYTFDEWTWILKLLGVTQKHGAEGAADDAGDEAFEANNGMVRKYHWSWLDRESPLMNGMDESIGYLRSYFHAWRQSLKSLASTEKGRVYDYMCIVKPQAIRCIQPRSSSLLHNVVD